MEELVSGAANRSLPEAQQAQEAQEAQQAQEAQALLKISALSVGFKPYGSLTEGGRKVFDQAWFGQGAPRVPRFSKFSRRAGQPQHSQERQKDEGVLRVFPPVFDTRLFYRSSHTPLKIEDQGSCASCVFISAAHAARVRSNISMQNGMRASRVWRNMLREHGESFHDACIEFTRAMCDAARQRHAHSPASMPLLDWTRFICCEYALDRPLAAAAMCRDRVAHCYHHQDGKPEEKFFTCEESVTGVVPHHFVEWVSTRGFHDYDDRLRIAKVKPETKSSGQRFMIADQVDATEVDQKVAEQINEQIRAIKTSLMTNGPLMVMIRIHGSNFDDWGRPSARQPQAGPDDSAEPGPGAEEPFLRLGYVLPSSGKMDEYHEVVLVGWSIDDAGKPCWIIQNSYGNQVNDSCAILPTHSELSDICYRDGYANADLPPGGFVFVRVVDAETIQHDIGSGLENNAIAFLPVPVASIKLAAGKKPKLEEKKPDRDSSPPASSSYEWIVIAAAVVILVFMFVRAQAHSTTRSITPSSYSF